MALPMLTESGRHRDRKLARKEDERVTWSAMTSRHSKKFSLRH